MRNAAGPRAGPGPADLPRSPARIASVGPLPPVRVVAEPVQVAESMPAQAATARSRSPARAAARRAAGRASATWFPRLPVPAGEPRAPLRSPPGRAQRGGRRVEAAESILLLQRRGRRSRCRDQAVARGERQPDAEARTAPRIRSVEQLDASAV